MKIDILTLFPEFFHPFLRTSIIKRGIEDGFIDIKTHQLREYSSLKHQRIDDTPYGGGAGMLMMFPPFYEAIKTLKREDSYVIMTSPQGQLLDQKKVTELSQKKHIIILCGHYEGIDARVEHLVDEELSIGNYILTGGEMPAMILADAVSRLVPGVIHEESSETDSLQKGWLKYPQYTKPEVYEGYKVPDILLSGHHQLISDWRKEQSIHRTLTKRPDLIKQIELTEEEKKMIDKLSKPKK
ncbi:MAG: tRNA (guanosine(37)-N1)-methyltransferase TrmD [Acholeplasmataceae bacterium]|jgi:tRNA (guanine37-N1)-methyltransferase|nr:tRNA (guanosine(37)-N1)-methyltransferase TrmD [Acholeplasmataceae bacterium]